MKLSCINSITLIVLTICKIECDKNNDIFNKKFAENKTKTILLWNAFYEWPDYKFGVGSKPFFDHKCKETRCYVTNQREWTSIEKFNAIVISGAHYQQYDKSNHPPARLPHQIYVYYSYESSNEWMVRPSLNGIFNLTVTHRLDADIPFPYFSFADNRGNYVAPAYNPKWIEPDFTDTVKLYSKLYVTKTRYVAWFVSHCFTDSKRENYVKSLKNYITIDTYGCCGTLKCPRTRNSTACITRLKSNYFFYLAFENALCKDYITEKVMHAMHNDVIPILYNGVNVNSFLPPKSYIDAMQYSPKDLAKLMKALMKDEGSYLQYFWWKSFYKIVEPTPPLCRLCEMLHDPAMKRKVYADLYTWWHGSNTTRICKPAPMIASVHQ